MRPSPQRWFFAVLLLVLVVPIFTSGQDEPDTPPRDTRPPLVNVPPKHEPIISESSKSGLEAFSPPPNDVRVSGDNEALAEVLIDVNPANPANLVVFGHSNTLGWMNSYYSIDGGASWTYVRVGSEQDGFPPEYRFDPTLAFDADGNLYVAYGVVTGVSGNRIAHVVVCKSTDGGKTYSQSAEVFGARQVGDLVGNDKFMLATGRDPLVADRQNVYVAWTWNIPTAANLDQQVAFSRSTDGGATFSFPIVVNDNSRTGRDRALFADPSVGPDGEVYLSWDDFDSPSRIMVDRSFDGGVTWGSDVVVAANVLPFKTFISPQPDRGINPGPVMDVDVSPGPHRGRAYVAYNGAGAYGIDVYLRYSDDHAATWSEPVRVCDDPGMRSQFLPWIDVGPRNGVVSVVFYDAREDPLDQAAKVYSAVSRTGGEGFETNHALADVPSNMTAANPYRYLGNYLEYIGVATLDCAAYVVWTDNRNQWPVYQGGFAHYYFDRIPFETEPPTISCPAPLVVECDGNAGLLATDPRAAAFLNGCVTGDDCAANCVVTWLARRGNGTFRKVTNFGPGAWTVRFSAFDEAGNSATCDGSLTVLDSPPHLEVTLTPDVLWPPDHRFVNVHATISLTDACSPPDYLLWALVSVTSDEPEDAAGDGSTGPDIQGVYEWQFVTDFQLRAERSGDGDGRRYQVVYYGSDGTYELYDTTYVTVPHDLDADKLPEAESLPGMATTVTRLHDARPNPFNPATSIGFDLARAERVTLVISDVSGARVRVLLDEPRPAGVHRAAWDGRDDSGRPVASGVYFVRMHAGGYASVRKLLLLK